MKRLKVARGRWLDARATLRACGILDPFFSANANWDLREHLLCLSQAVTQEERGGLSAEDFAVFVMLRIANLAEADVANYLGVAPAKAYAAATRAERALGENSTESGLVCRFAEGAVEALQFS
jgi:hypothetical protein